MKFPLHAALLVAACLAGLLSFATPCLAARLVMELATQALVRDDGLLEVRCQVTNRGDEPATNLQTMALNLPGAQPSPLVEVLPDGKSAELFFTAPAPPSPPGRYASILRLEFQDLNQFPFSALGYTYFHRGKDWASPLVVQAQPLRLEGRGSLSLRLLNTEDAPIQVSLRVFGPRELLVDQEPRQLEIPAGQTRDLTLEVSNLSGMDNAEYHLLVWTVFERDGRHTEKVTEVKTTLSLGQNLFRRTLPWWLGGLGLLALAVLIQQIRSRRR